MPQHSSLHKLGTTHVLWHLSKRQLFMFCWGLDLGSRVGFRKPQSLDKATTKGMQRGAFHVISLHFSTILSFQNFPLFISIEFHFIRRPLKSICFTLFSDFEILFPFMKRNEILPYQSGSIWQGLVHFPALHVTTCHFIVFPLVQNFYIFFKHLMTSISSVFLFDFIP